MRLRLLVESNLGFDYDEILAFALEAERLGFDGLFCSDHYGAPAGHPEPIRPLDAWTTMAGLARETTSIRLGTLMTPVTFRLPGPLAIAVAQVDRMSGGRVELGLGTGWHDQEHRAFGIPFPERPERFELLAEQLEIITGIWAASPAQPFDYSSSRYLVAGSPGVSGDAARRRPPVLIGGRGPRLTPRLAAAFADEFNVPVAGPEQTGAQFERVSRACADVGRDPLTMTFSAAQTVCVGESAAEVAARARAIGRDLEQLTEVGLAGSPESVVDQIGVFAAAGADRLYLQFLDLRDLAHLRLVAARVLPAVATL